MIITLVQCLFVLNLRLVLLAYSIFCHHMMALIAGFETFMFLNLTYLPLQNDLPMPYSSTISILSGMISVFSC